MGNNSFFNNRHPEEAPIIEILSKLLQNVENEVIEFKLASNTKLKNICILIFDFFHRFYNFMKIEKC